jgi:hypothetical protein
MFQLIIELLFYPLILYYDILHIAFYNERFNMNLEQNNKNMLK